MTGRQPPRYLPTLTEVVGTGAAQSGRSDATLAQSHSPPVAPAAPDKSLLAQQIIRQIRPQLEAELRNIAQELFEAQFSALLPSLQLQIEESVRDAIDQAFPDPADR